jgi:hypothetical protein
MAMTTCKACGGEIADTAMTCPKCGDVRITAGAVYKQSMGRVFKVFKWIALFFIFLIVVFALKSCF